MFQLTRDEVENLVKSQNVTSPEKTIFKGQDGGRRKLPYAFTEEGTNMLATVIKNDIATKQSIYIMRSFKEMKHYLVENQSLLNNVDLLKLSTIVIQNKEDIHNIENRIEIILLHMICKSEKGMLFL